MRSEPGAAARGECDWAGDHATARVAVSGWQRVGAGFAGTGTLPCRLSRVLIVPMMTEVGPDLAAAG